MIDRQTPTPNTPPAGEPARPSAGALLQFAREDAGLSLEEVAQQLKLAPRQVKAIEDDDYAELPGRTFVRGFVRNYARLLQLDPNAVLASLPGGSTPALDSPALHQTGQTMGELPADERRRTSWTRWAIPLTLVAIIGAAVFYEFTRGREFGGPTPRSDAALAGNGDPTATPGQPVTGSSSSAANQAPGQSLPNPLAGKEPAPAGSQVAAGGAAAPGTPASSPGSTAAATPTGASPAPAAESAAEAALVLTFRDSSWTTVRQKNGEVLVSKLMAGGQSQTFSGTPPFELVIGNATEVGVTYRGQPVDLAPHTRSGVARLTLK